MQLFEFPGSFRTDRKSLLSGPHVLDVCVGGSQGLCVYGPLTGKISEVKAKSNHEKVELHFFSTRFQTEKVNLVK